MNILTRQMRTGTSLNTTLQQVIQSATQSNITINSFTGTVQQGIANVSFQMNQQSQIAITIDQGPVKIEYTQTVGPGSFSSNIIVMPSWRDVLSGSGASGSSGGTSPGATGGGRLSSFVCPKHRVIFIKIVITYHPKHL